MVKYQKCKKVLNKYKQVYKHWYCLQKMYKINDFGSREQALDVPKSWILEHVPKSMILEHARPSKI